jgi:murein DD-endopeptidase MepM/ murein hydrolase activator NlpD
LAALLLIESRPALAEPRLRVSTTKPKPGDPVLVTVEGVDGTPKGTGGKVPLVFFPIRRGWQAVFAVPLEEPPAELKVEINGVAQQLVLAVRPHEFPEETVTVAPELAEPPADKRKQIDAENGAAIDALKNTSPPLFRVPFRWSAGGKMTSPYGAWRTFNGGHRSQHLGMDHSASAGAPVRAVQAGKVTLVCDCFLMGGTVVVIHGAGIASTYFHLSDIAVAAGDDIERGAVLGKVGLTGRTTGPHTHLGIWVPGGFIDPAVFLRLNLGPPQEAR